GERVAGGGAGLGCVARPPGAEEEPPFPEFGWRLWQASEAVEEWHEDHRTLYVACTRAQDYLVLSAALDPKATPANAWIMTLGERFDVLTGNCLDTAIPAERRPRVRVTDNLDGLPGVPGGVVTTPPAPVRSGSADEVGPLPVRLGAKRIFTVAEVERCLLLAAEPEETLRPADVAYQFDAE